MDYRNIYKNTLSQQNFIFKTFGTEILETIVEIINNYDNLSIKWLSNKNKRTHLGIILILLAIIIYFLQDF
jgi:hypothetical protein